MRFSKQADTPLWQALRCEVEGRLGFAGRAALAPPGLWAKAAFYLAIVAAAYALLMSGTASFAMLTIAYTVFNLAALLLVLNLGHDAAHDALTANRTLNAVIADCSFALVGIDGYLWRLRHVRSHHVFPNINGCDADIDHNPFLRLSPNHPWRPRHRWQHLYASLVYMTVHLHAILVQDAIYIFKKSLANLRDIRHSAARYAGFVAHKLGYFAALLAVPIACSPLPAVEVATAYVLSTAVTSLFFVLVLIGTHFADGNAFPDPGTDGRLASSFVGHVFASSLDWSPTSRFAAFLIGRLNAHAAHHLFPKVSHAHYGAITEAVERLAREHGVAYRRTDLPGMLAAHFRHLAAMGRNPGRGLLPANVPS